MDFEKYVGNISVVLPCMESLILNIEVMIVIN